MSKSKTLDFQMQSPISDSEETKQEKLSKKKSDSKKSEIKNFLTDEDEECFDETGQINDPIY